jgi:hypothetical protein
MRYKTIALEYKTFTTAGGYVALWSNMHKIV